MQYQGFLTEPTTLTLFVINIMGGGGSGVMAASMTALAASGVHDKGGLVVRKKAFDNLHYARAHKNSFAF